MAGKSCPTTPSRITNINVTVTERRQGNETEIEKLRLERFSVAWGERSLKTERFGYPEYDQIVGQGPYQPEKQIGSDSSHDPMGSGGPFAKSLAQNEKGEEHQEKQTQTVGYEDESLMRKQIPYPHEDEAENAP